MEDHAEEFSSTSEIKLGQPDAVIHTTQVTVSIDPPIIKVPIYELEYRDGIEVPPFIHHDFDISVPLSFIGAFEFNRIEKVGIVNSVFVPDKHAIQCGPGVVLSFLKAEFATNDTFFGFSVSFKNYFVHQQTI